MKRWTRGTTPALFVVASLVALAVSGPDRLRADPGYVVAAPDRGFLGNEEVRDAVADLREVYPATELWVVTSERTEEHLRSAVERLRAREGIDRVVVLPLFMSEGHAMYGAARRAADSVLGEGARWAEPLGSSYLAEEILFDRVGALSSKPDEERLLVVGAGAGSAEAARAVREALTPVAERATRKFGLAGSPVVETLYHGSAPDSLQARGHERVVERAREIAEAGETPLVVPFGLARRYTTMMSDWRWLAGGLAQAGASYREIPVLPHENVGHWLRKAATRHRELRPDEIGVVLVPHGADFNWNETMRAGIEPLRDEYMTEDAFSMVDPVVVERAVRRLEARGAKAAVVVRIFSLESSFREKAEYILGLRRDYDHFPTRIRSPLEFHTLGGMEATPHLAAGLADRVRTLSEDPSRETVILLGHGAGPDSANAHWIDNLHRIADGVEERTNGEFRDYRVHTWREDWPEKRDASVTEIRRLVRDASEGDGIALVVPQRTVGQGPAREYLDGLDYRYGEGLAPHPEFTAWLRATIEQGIEAVADSGPPSATVPD